MARNTTMTGRAGVNTRTCRLTGTETTVGRATALGLDPEHPWYVVCEAHGTLLGTATRRGADRQRVRPDGWCEACRRAVNSNDDRKGA